MRVIADAMLGRLARWLRALGRDVAHDPSADDAALVHLARTEGRTLLSRDRHLCSDPPGGAPRPGWCILVASPEPAGQVREVADPLDLFAHGWRDRLFTRCMLCNAPLEEATHHEVVDALPPEVGADPRVRSAGFRRCPSCGRVYWEGSHTRRMRRWLEAVAASL